MGKKISFINGNDQMLVLVTHHSGRRELYFFENKDDDESVSSFTMSSDETKQLGTQLLGSAASFDNGEMQKMKIAGKQIILDWIKVTNKMKITGMEIGEINQLIPLGASFIGIIRDDEFTVELEEDSRIEADDTILIVGKREKVSEFAEQCKGDIR